MWDQGAAGRKPAVTGNQAGRGPLSEASRAGMIRLQTLAAIITPAANPSIAFWKRSPIPCLRRKTKDAPRVFPIKGTMRAMQRASIVVVSMGVLSVPS